MSLVVLQPTANSEGTEHYRQTIVSPVRESEWQPHVTPEVAARLSGSFSDGAVPFWGVTEGDKGRNRTKWQRINPGDVVLFAREGSYFAMGVVALPFENEALAEVLEVAARSPSLQVVRRYFGEDRKVFEVSVSEHPADRYTYSIQLRRGWQSGAEGAGSWTT
jgi:hypothetical protein